MPMGIRLQGDAPVTLDELDEALAIYEQKERAHVQELIEQVMRAFPDGDVETHHDYHKQRLKAARAEEEFWKTAKTTLIQAGVTGALSLLKVLILLAALGLTAKFALPDAVTKIITGVLDK